MRADKLFRSLLQTSTFPKIRTIHFLYLSVYRKYLLNKFRKAFKTLSYTREFVHFKPPRRKNKRTFKVNLKNVTKFEHLTNLPLNWVRLLSVVFSWQPAVNTVSKEHSFFLPIIND